MAEWKRYQEETAKLFRDLGCSVETDLLVKGVRSEHRLDVSVRFTRFGLKQHWIIECKFWHRRVPKERVEVLKSITGELGADRGILIAERGHQSGAYEAATLTNITLTTLAKLREATKGELLALGLSTVRRRAIVIQHDVRSLEVEVPLLSLKPLLVDGSERERSNRLGWTMITAKPGADHGILANIFFDAHLVESHANDAERGSFPVWLICHFDKMNDATQSKDHQDSFYQAVRWDCNNLEEFVASASDLLDTLDRVLLKQKVQVANCAPL
jgi:hypothetical protein